MNFAIEILQLEVVKLEQELSEEMKSQDMHSSTNNSTSIIDLQYDIASLNKAIKYLYTYKKED